MKKFIIDIKEVGKDLVGGLKFLAKCFVLPVWWLKFVRDEKAGRNKGSRSVIKTASQLVKICCVKVD